MELKWNPPNVPNQTIAAFAWGNSEVDYAADVALGPTYVGGTRGVARDWTEVSIQRTDCPAVLAANYRGDIRQAFQGFVDHMGADFSDVIDNHDFGSGGKNEKQFRPGVPTWSSISDSGALRDSLQIEVREQ